MTLGKNGMNKMNGISKGVCLKITLSKSLKISFPSAFSTDWRRGDWEPAQ